MSILKANRIENLTTTDGGINVDNSGRILIGTTTPGPAAGEQLTINNSTNSGITIRSGTSAGGAILFEDSAQDRGEIQYNHNGDFMRFKTSGSERCRILSSGGLTFNGDTATANALNDYEEGTWTPTVTPSSGSFTTAVYGSRDGYYTKIGRMVHIQIIVNFSSFTVR